MPLAQPFEAALLLAAGSISIAVPDVIIDASVAERSRANPSLTADLQVFCWATYAIGALVAVASKGTILNQTRSVRGLYALLTAASTIILLPAGMGWLGEQRKRKRDSRASFSAPCAASAAARASLSRDLVGRSASVASRTTSVGGLAAPPQGVLNGCSTSGSSMRDTGAGVAYYSPPAGAAGVGTIGSNRAGGDRSASTASHPSSSVQTSCGMPTVTMFILGGIVAVGSILLSSFGVLFERRGWGAPLAAIAVSASLCAVVGGLEWRTSPILAKTSLYLFLEGVSDANV